MQKIARQNDTVVTSHFMQLEKVGRGLLWKAFGVRGSASFTEQEGGKMKGSVVENASEHWNLESK